LDRDQNFTGVSGDLISIKWMWNRYSVRRRCGRVKLE